MSPSCTRKLLATTIALTAMAGCAKQANLAQAPLSQGQKPAVTGNLFSGALKAPADAKKANYGVQALLQYAHLIGAPFQDSSNSGAYQYDPQLAYNTQDHTYLAAWVQNNSVHGRIKDSHGVQQVPDFTITGNGYLAPDYKAGYIPWLNQFVVVYARYTGPNASDVYMQRLSTSGALIGGAIPISTAIGVQDVPDLAVDPINHNVEVVWEDNRSGDYDIYGRLVTYNGNQTVFLTNEMLIGNSAPEPDHGFTSADQDVPTIAFGTAQQVYVVAWQDARNKTNDMVSSGVDIYGTVLNAHGLPTTSNYAISTLEGDQLDPEIAYMPSSDKFLLVYDSANNGASDTDILGSGLDGDGSVLGWGTLDNQYGNQYYPAVAANPASMTWLVAFSEDGPTEGMPTHINGRHVGWAFQLGDVFPVTPNDPDSNTDAAIAANPDDQQFLVDYEDAKNGGPYAYIEGQLVDRGY